MEYEYNGNLLEEERIEMVAKEIVNKYPQINIETAKEIAMLEGKISTDKNVQMEFNRLYNIMLIINEDKETTSIVYNDLMNFLENSKNEENIDYYYSISLEISNFLGGKREFPYLEEF